MKKLIICEKPSLAANVASALKVFNRKDGYYENDNIIVTFAFGHLFGLKDVKNYLGKEKVGWSEVELPFIPNPFEFKLKDDDGVKKQFEIVKNLANRNDVSEIVNCGDADREGQIIIDLIIEKIGINKSVKRLWLPEQTENTIKNQLNNIDDNSNYKNLYNEGLARTYIDWLLGINTTIYLTVKSGTFLRAGRVLIPIVKFIYDRDMLIKNFEPENYFQVEDILKKDDVELKLTVNKKFNTNQENEAKSFAFHLNKHKATVISVENNEKKKYPGKLFSLSKLQGHLSKKCKMSFANSEKIIQELYLKGYITYPRTNTEYLSENEKGKIKDILNLLTDYKVEFKDSKKIFDDSKIESHSAITITSKIPNIEKDFSNDSEKVVYKAVFNRFVSNFLIEETILNETVVLIGVAEEFFEFKGSIIVQEGFFRYEPQEIKNNLPNFQIGEEFTVNFKPIKKKTSPPKKITEERLANFLKNPFKDEKEHENDDDIDIELNDDKEYEDILKGVEIGTEATRTGIVENAKKSNYISQNKESYSIEPLGIQFIELLNKLNINLYKKKTVEFSMMLKKIFNNESSIDDILAMTTKEIQEFINSNVVVEKINRESLKESLGACPICKSPVYEYKTKEDKKFYPCSNKECKFKLFEMTKIFGSDVKITSYKAKSLIAKKKTKFTLYSKAKGKEYDANIVFDGMDGNFVKYKMDGFPDKKK